MCDLDEEDFREWPVETRRAVWRGVVLLGFWQYAMLMIELNKIADREVPLLLSELQIGPIWEAVLVIGVFQIAMLYIFRPIISVWHAVFVLGVWQCAKLLFELHKIVGPY